jgi:hypothetical protein
MCGMFAPGFNSMGNKLMAFDVTILSKKIEGLKEAYENGRFSDALVGSLNTGSGLMQQRIFNQNTDIEGQSFGNYIGKKRKVPLVVSSNKTQNKRNKAIAGLELTSYQRKRASKGRQISRKDLEFTGGVRRAIETQIADEKAAVLQFNNDLAAKIARGQEQQITNIRNGQKGTTKGANAVKIFSLNQSEKETVIEQGAELIKQILKPK